ncbi:aspartyl-tRNA(Asn)/glutamyl-tRNA(Gln) amidotransferase subunit A [Hymenobacter luteus]|uniref:Glutamyl-tRNA(Gln) amidotransferase subunit A n=2 Tax=Hymenobacter TaxID=89966 RepID=A0A7W9SYS7_9BACT|nr:MULTISPECIES: Asp-tRNA(Asn)/Glu-tRNA(Gln) amidotransferase subunit GatA [Hymenobacter]MBB4599850.1 aspartyl-tRNA(Asn)/glutamyl-tRNA(Gln) amidotransferase subunit A [Hymenobacter latericoloratus]MBB6057840.1 aspartyl-tRNA(Asn)/glutamyl-tRNA(Gln) amidotransferase subunit A [Hymenobacter luteus]
MRRFNSLTEVRHELTAGTTSCRQLVEYYLDNIRRKQHLNAFLEVWPEEALAQADAVDAKLAAGTAGKLAGMVIGLKDVLAYEGHALQSSSHILDGFKSLFTGTAVQRLLDEDAILIGRQNCDEFAMGASNETSFFGPARNEVDPERVPGGSSGGSAVAVQADLCLASIGSDTGGSVRQPAAFCGIVGFKPTYSRISRYGLVAYASSFDQIGTLTRSVEDAALLLEVMAGSDRFDSTASQREVPAYSQQLAPAPHYRIGYIKDCLERPGLNAEIKAATEQALDRFRGQGHVVEGVDFPYLDYIVPTYYILTTAEASSNLSRYDGVKFGYRAPDATDLESLYKKTRSQGFGPEVQRRILLGTFVLSASYYDAYYTKAQRVRRLIKEKTDELLREYDFLVLPTTPTTAFRIGDVNKDTLAMYLADIFTVQASLAGVPAISVPAGTDSQGLPIGLQILSGAFREEHLLAFANSVTETLASVEA